MYAQFCAQQRPTIFIDFWQNSIEDLDLFNLVVLLKPEAYTIKNGTLRIGIQLQEYREANLL